MSTQPFKYSPALEDPQTLKASLIDRERELNRLLKGLVKNTDREINQHFILVGPRGIGKSYLLLLLHHTVRGNIQWDEFPQTIEENWCSALFAEEEYGVNSLSDILATTLRTLKGALGDQEKTTNLIEKAKSNEKKVHEEIVEYLQAWRKSSKQRILLLIDNLQEILPHLTEKEQSFLRKVLTKEDIFMMVGGAPTLFKTLTDYDKPFYHFFDSIRLEELSRKEVKELLKQKLKLNNKKEQLDQIEDREDRLDALIHLTGGNPRLVISLYKIVVEAEIPDVEENFKQLIDELTPYFQARLKSLSRQQREILDCIAQKSPPINPTEIANSIGSKVNSVNSQLKRLKDKGLVKQLETEGRKASYDLTEQLFRYWRQMRTEAGRKKLNFIVRFIETWFTPKELQEQVGELLEELLTTDSPAEMKERVRELSYRTEAIPSSERFTDQKFIDALDDIAHDELVSAKQRLDELEMEDSDGTAKITKGLLKGVIESRKGNYSEALQLFDEKVPHMAKSENDEAALAISYYMKASTKLFVVFTEENEEIDDKLYEIRKEFYQSLKILTEKEDVPPKLLEKNVEVLFDISLFLSFRELSKSNHEKASELLDSATDCVGLIDIEYSQSAIGRYLKSILDIDIGFTKKAITKIKNKIEEYDVDGLEKFIKPYSISMEYLETKNDALLNNLPPKLKEITKEIIDQLSK